MAKSKKNHFYLVFWEAKNTEDNEVVKGWTEINMPKKWHPGESGGVLDYIIQLNGDDFWQTMITGAMYLGKFEAGGKENDS